MKNQTLSDSSYKFDYLPQRDRLLNLLTEIHNLNKITWPSFRKLLHKYPTQNGVFSKNQIIQALEGFQNELENGQLSAVQFGWLNDENLRSKIQKKPTRTQSGVTPVTVLTKPFPCPGQCIFCPNDVRMPKSYLSDEPGAQRAERNQFDPYLQTFSRLKALQAIGHTVDKVELIVLGGTWSFYPESYQIWFVKRMFEAVNDFGEENNLQFENLLPKIGLKNHRELEKNTTIIRNVKPLTGQASETYNQIIRHQLKQEQKNNPQYVASQTATWDELFEEHKKNEKSEFKVSGLVIETRPDSISEEEVIRIRKLGCTKTQIGFQSLQDDVLAKNHRGHDVQAIARAVKLLRFAGFKIHAHWMANLYGSNPQADIDDYYKMFNNSDFRPDELKVYPCSLLETAELMDYYAAGLWKPYSHPDLLNVVSSVMEITPEYCRLTRIIRDIPSTDIVVGNKFTNFRQMAEEELVNRKIKISEIRSREIKNQIVSLNQITLEIQVYNSSFGREYFLQYITEDRKIVGFLRLALPGNSLQSSPQESDFNLKYLDQKIAEVDSNFIHPFIEELSGCGIIREIHVYGKVVQVGKQNKDKPQHIGLGKELIETACKLAKENNFTKLAVISSIGTRDYYRKRGFEDGELYQIRKI